MPAVWPAHCVTWAWCGWMASSYIPSRTNWGAVSCVPAAATASVRCSTALAAMEPGGATDFFGVLRDFIGRYSQRGLVIVISDFLDEQGCERALQFLADFGHELMLLQVWSEQDRTPPWDGELELEDAETGGRLKVQFDQSARDRYTRAFDDFTGTIQKLALRNGGRYAGICTAQPVEEVIFGPLVRARGVA